MTRGAQALDLPILRRVDDRNLAVEPIDAVIRGLEAAKGKTLTAADADWLIDVLKQQNEALKQLAESNRALKDAVDLYRLKAAQMEVQPHSPNEKREPAAAAEVPSDSHVGDGPSGNARRILASLAAQRRSEFSSGETPALGCGMHSAELEAAVNELLDHELIEELSYTPFEGTRFGCTARGMVLLESLSERGG